jgi:methane monooxygenase component C
MYKITAYTEDGQVIEFPASPNEDVVTSALKQDVILLTSCREGGCATCKAECTDGEYEMANASVQALPPDEEEDGFVLLCCTYPRSNLTLNLPYTFDRVSFEKNNKEWTGDILAVERMSSNVMRLAIRLADPETGGPVKMKFSPGQYIEIEVPGTNIWRSYSMACTNGSSDLEFLIRLLPNGFFSKFLVNEAAPGMRVKLHGPSGAFAMRENGFRPRYFIAGGTGLSPVLSMIRHMQVEGHPQQAELFFGVTHQHELFYADELRDIENTMSNLNVHISVMNPELSSPYSQGTVVDDLVKHFERGGPNPDIYVCGPPGMIDAALVATRKYGMPADQVFYEKFLASGQIRAAE